MEDEFILDSESAPEALEEEDLFGVHRGGLGAEGFGVQLVELPLPSLLGALAGGTWAELPDAGDAVADGGGLGEGADDGRGGFGAEGEIFAGEVLKGIHFLFHDFAVLAEGSGEEFGALDDGGADFGVAIELKDGGGGAFGRRHNPAASGGISLMPRTDGMAFIGLRG